MVDLFWHLGDIGYADDAFLHDIVGFEYEQVYNGFMHWIENITSAKPYMVAVGNHESECHSPACLIDKKKSGALSNFSAYNTHWRMPFGEDVDAVARSAGRSTSNMWYSFNYGLAHFVNLNTETDWDGAPEEKKGDSGLLPAGGFGREGE